MNSKEEFERLKKHAYEHADDLDFDTASAIYGVIQMVELIYGEILDIEEK